MSSKLKLHFAPASGIQKEATELGLETKSAEPGYSNEEWIYYQLIRAVQPAFWEQYLEQPGEKIVQLFQSDELGKKMIAALVLAAVANKDKRWGQLLFSNAEIVYTEVLPLISPQKREEYMIRYFDKVPDQMMDVAFQSEQRWSLPLTMKVLAQFADQPLSIHEKLIAEACDAHSRLKWRECWIISSLPKITKQICGRAHRNISGAYFISKKRSYKHSTHKTTHMSTILRQHAETLFAQELEELKKQDGEQKPVNWVLSPRAVVTYLVGGKLKNGFEITPKYIGNKRLMEIAVATLTTDRALLLYGLPGTAKSWVSEHLAAAISGNSTLIVQGTAGTGEESIRYGWNYARLLAEGPTEKALVETPIMRAMKDGKIARIEELTRIGADVQDALITILSEKTLPVPELNTEVQAVKGFNIIATANNRDKGVNELSSALKRRFNTVILPVPDSMDEEIDIVKRRVESFEKVMQLLLNHPHCRRSAASLPSSANCAAVLRSMEKQK